MLDECVELLCSNNVYDSISVYLQSDSKHDAANAYAEAAKYYKKVDTNGM